MDTPAVTPIPQPHPTQKVLVAILTAIIAVGVYLVAAHFWNFWPFGAPKTVACTMEAKICPDGSGVGRSGPNCEFAACPESITYSNSQYGFSVALPSSWEGYTIVAGSREIRGIGSGSVVATAPTISIRHPLWTATVPRQDIPIDIYTLAQWQGIIDENYSVGAAPIPPSELARNGTYVFALPARYNYAFPEGFEEVETILAGKPVTAFVVSSGNNAGSGIAGSVFTGPTCPVVRVDDPSCNDRPYQGQFIVRNATSNAEVSRFTTDASGRFQVALAPGTYTIEPVKRIGIRDQPQSVVVQSGKFTNATLTFDTGIR